MMQVQIKQLSHRIDGIQVLEVVNLSIEHKQRWALVGPSGAGKSTLIKVAHGLLPVQQGAVEKNASLTEESYVFQQPVLLRASVWSNLVLPLSIKHASKAEMETRGNHALDMVGLLNRRLDPAVKLSGGEQQKLALARALISKPQLLWLDEPTASLDTASTRQIEALLTTKTTEITKVLVTHNLRQAQRLCTHMAVLHQGKLLQADAIERVYAQPANEKVAAFLQGDLID